MIVSLGDFNKGDRVIYRGKNSRIPYGTYGTVIAFRDERINDCCIAVKWEGQEGEYSDLDGIDPTMASLWCSPVRLELDESRDGWVNSECEPSIEELLF